MLLLGGFAIAGALSKHNIAKTLASSVLSRVGQRPGVVLLANMLMATFCSMWIRWGPAPGTAGQPGFMSQGLGGILPLANRLMATFCSRWIRWGPAPGTAQHAGRSTSLPAGSQHISAAICRAPRNTTAGQQSAATDGDVTTCSLWLQWGAGQARILDQPHAMQPALRSASSLLRCMLVCPGHPWWPAGPSPPIQRAEAGCQAAQPVLQQLSRPGSCPSAAHRTSAGAARCRTPRAAQQRGGACAVLLPGGAHPAHAGRQPQLRQKPGHGCAPAGHALFLRTRAQGGYIVGKLPLKQPVRCAAAACCSCAPLLQKPPHPAQSTPLACTRWALTPRLRLRRHRPGQQPGRHDQPHQQPPEPVRHRADEPVRLGALLGRLVRHRAARGACGLRLLLGAAVRGVPGPRVHPRAAGARGAGAPPRRCLVLGV